MASKSSDTVDRAVETIVNAIKDGGMRLRNNVNKIVESIDESIKGMNNYDKPINDNHTNKSCYDPVNNQADNMLATSKSVERIPNQLTANLVGIYDKEKQVRLNRLAKGDRLDLLREPGNMWEMLIL